MSNTAKEDTDIPKSLIKVEVEERQIPKGLKSVGCTKYLFVFIKECQTEIGVNLHLNIKKKCQKLESF